MTKNCRGKKNGEEKRFNEKDLLTKGSENQLVCYKNKKRTTWFRMIQILRRMAYDHTENTVCIVVHRYACSSLYLWGVLVQTYRWQENTHIRKQ
jgi:hypothetical protein